ncbi:MAG TPA: biotin-dependent carboxyltransferase family protein [Pyrinomonadaceae bacterium]
MTLLIRKPGILTTVQDLGRVGEQRSGLNPSGVMDCAAARILNIILGNEERDAVLETHFPAAGIEFEVDVAIAVGGADFAAEIDGRPIRNGITVFAKTGSVLSFPKRIRGQRAYLAVRGGVQVDEWRGSRSTNLIAGIGGFAGRALSTGDRIPCASSPETRPVALGNSLQPGFVQCPTIRIVAGNEYEFLTALSERSFLREEFLLTNDCNRMGYRLAGEPLYLLDSRDMVSSAVTFGTIQLLPDGQMIILMADHQTSGGYPRVGNVVSVDLPVLAQCGPGDRLRFELVSTAQAERLALQFERELNFLRVGCRLQGQNADY